MKSASVLFVLLLASQSHASGIDLDTVTELQSASATCVTRADASEAFNGEIDILTRAAHAAINAKTPEARHEKVLELKYRISELVSLSNDREVAVIKQILADAGSGHYDVLRSMAKAQLGNETALSEIDSKALSDIFSRIEMIEYYRRVPTVATPSTPTESSASFLKMCTTILANGKSKWVYVFGAVENGKRIIHNLETLGQSDASVRHLLHSSDEQ